MGNSRTKNAALIFSSGVVLQLVRTILSFISRTIFIYALGANYLGVDGLFTNILQVLSLTELGVGVAITYYLYQPLAQNDIERIKSLMVFYKFCYRVIGITILIIGLLLIPFLPNIVNFNSAVKININLIYVMYLVKTASTYLFFAYQITLIKASQKGYIINNISTIFTIITTLIEAIILIIFRNYIFYLFFHIAMQIIQNIIISVKAEKIFPFIKEKEYIRITKTEIKRILKDVYSIFILKISGTMFSATDNIIISILIGTIYVGFYSNYLLIISMISTFISVFQNSVIAAIGNINALESNEKQLQYFERLDFFNYWIVSFCSISLFNLLNPFITLWIGKDFLFPDLTVAIIVLNFFRSNLLNVVFAFRDTKGLFKYARYRQLIAGIANIVLSIILGMKFGVTGIFVATFFCGLMISWSPYPRTLYKYGFEANHKPYFTRNIYRHIITIAISMLVYLIGYLVDNDRLSGFIIKLIITVTIPNIIMYFIYKNKDEFIFLKEKLVSLFKNYKNR